MPCARPFWRAAQRYHVVWVGYLSSGEGIRRMESDCMRRVVRHLEFNYVSPRLSDLSLGGRMEKVKDWFIATCERRSMV